ncbi:polyprenyl synthetase family protein [Urechidicola sp. KH5]
MILLEDYKQEFLKYIEEKTRFSEPSSLYEPVNYILQIGGKRIRPILALMGADVFGANYKDALDAALAVEVFHNFTLLHDDIMDDAPLRRGKQTVHEKWDINTGILSGDAMLILAYQFLEKYEPEIFKKLIAVFSKTAREVCEGQQYDIDFETRNDVAIDEYIKMIRLKTSVLVGAALKMGAIVAGVSEEQTEAIYDFGVNLGIAFQLQDDYLDAFGDPKSFGKKVGGDIIENKKTFLYLKALELGTDEQKDILFNLFQLTEDSEDKINKAKSLFKNSGATSATRNEILNYTNRAFEILDKLQIEVSKKKLLQAFGDQLMHRTV